MSHLQILISKERRSYLFSSLCSGLTVFYLFYHLFQADLFKKLYDFNYLALVLVLITIGNVFHGYFAFRSFQSLSEQSGLSRVIVVKKRFYKSLAINFAIPYFVLIIFFIFIRQYLIASASVLLFTLTVMCCYFFDIKSFFKIVSKFRRS